jgi:hypothetical protein
MTKKQPKRKKYSNDYEDTNLERKKKISFKKDKQDKYEKDVEDEWEDYQKYGYTPKN